MDQLDAFLDGKTDTIPTRDHLDDFLDGKSDALQPGPQTFIGKSVDAIKKGLSYPLGLPANPANVAGALGSGSPEKAYLELMPQMEKGGAVVKEAAGNVLGEMPSNANVGGAVKFGVGLVPFEPSSLVAPAFARGAGVLSKLGTAAPTVMAPFLRSPATVEQDMGNTVKSLGQPGLTPEEAGQGAMAAYNKRVGAPLRDLTKPPEIVPPNPPARSGPEIFNPEYKKVSSQVSPKPVSMSQSGETMTAASQRKLTGLLKTESTQWGKLSQEHFDKPVDMEPATNYIQSVFEKQGIQPEPSALERLNPNLRAVADKQPDPEAYAKGILQIGQESNTPERFMATASGNEAEQAVQPNLQRGASVLNKVLAFSRGKGQTFGQVKSLRSQIGGMIDWTGRGDELNHTFKGVYRSLTDVMGNSAKAGGFEGDVNNAMQSSRDLFSYTDKPSSKIIAKSKYQSDLPNRLITTKSPERVKELFSEHGMTPEEQAQVRRGVLDEINRKASGDPKKFARALDEYTPETRKAIFGPQTDLVESLKNTVKTLNDEVAKSKLKPVQGKTYAPEEILSKNGLELDKLFRRSQASELVDKLIKDGTPELARTAVGALGKDGTTLVRRGIINKIIEDSKIPQPDGKATINPRLLKSALERLKPDFVKEIFGEDAELVNAMKEGSTFYNDQMSKYGRTPYIPIKREIEYLVNLGRRYRIAPKLAKIVENAAGKEAANRVVPPMDISPPRSGVRVARRIARDYRGTVSPVLTPYDQTR